MKARRRNAWASLVTGGPWAMITEVTGQSRMRSTAARTAGLSRKAMRNLRGTCGQIIANKPHPAVDLNPVLCQHPHKNSRASKRKSKLFGRIAGCAVYCGKVGQMHFGTGRVFAQHDLSKTVKCFNLARNANGQIMALSLKAT